MSDSKATADVQAQSTMGVNSDRAIQPNSRAQVAPGVVDLICLKAAEIHNLGRGVSDSEAQSIIDDIRLILETK